MEGLYRSVCFSFEGYSKVMNIAFVEPHVAYGIGGIRRIIEVSNRLIKFGHEVSIYTPKGNPCTWIKNNIPTFKLSKLHKKQFDFVIFNLAEQYVWAQKANAKKKVFWVLAAEAEYKQPNVPLNALQEDFLFMCNSKYTRNYILRNRKRSIKYDIPIISAGINRDHFKYVPDVIKDYDFLYTGSKRPWKGTHIIEEIMHTGMYKFLKMEGLSTPQDKMWELYNRCTCFVSAAQVEGFSMPGLEALACGTPLITTDDGGNRDFIVDGENAIVVKRDTMSIKRGLDTLLKNKSLRRKFIQNGLKTASDPRFNWDNIAKKFEGCLEKWM